MKLVLGSSLAAAIFAAWLAYSLTSAQWEVRYLKLERAHATLLAANKDLALQVERTARDNMDLLLEAIYAGFELKERANEVTTVEVIRYVESDAAGSCDLDYGWLRAHDARASFVSGAAPADPGNATGASGVTEADALQVVSANYGLCADDRQQLAWWIAYNERVLGPYRAALERAQRIE
jgi:hypothetical protein